MAESAFGIIRSFLGRYGLESLSKWAWKQYQSGDSMEEILLEMRSTTAYKNRFPAMEELSKAGRSLSEEAYINYESGLRNLVQQFGLNQRTYGSRDYVAELLTNDVSLSEAQSRMQLAAAASTTAPREYREQARRLYGVSNGDWVSMWLEPDRALPELEKQFAAASIAGEVTIANLGQLSRTMAERLVEAGLTREQARQGLTRASRELSVRLPGEADRALGVDAMVSGALGVGREAEEFERRTRQRVAAFAGGGQAATSQTGAALGSTRR